MMEKLFFRYGYELNNDFKVNINYIYIINDNIAITNHSKIFGAGITYNMNKKASLNFTQFYSNYKNFDIYQSDLRIDFKTKIKAIKIKFSSIMKYINIVTELPTQNKNLEISNLRFIANYKF